MESANILQKKQTQQKSFFLSSSKKQPTAIKVTNIIFTKQDMSQFDILLNLRNNKSSIYVKNQSSSQSALTHLQTIPQNIICKDNYQDVCYPKKKYQKCSHQTKISQMFFVKSLNLQSKPTPPRLLANINNLNHDNKQNIQHQNSKDKRDKKMFKSIDAKTHLGCSNISSMSFNKPKILKEFQRKNTLQPISSKNKSHNLISSSVVQLKRSTCILTESLNQNKNNRNSQSQKQKNQIDRLQTQPKQIKDKQKEMQVLPSPPKINFNFTSSNLKDSLLQGKLYKYWEDLDNTAKLHKIQISTLDYQKNPIKFYAGKGNNSRLVKQVMKKRWWWNYSDDKNAGDVYFVWLQLKDKTFYKKIQQLQLQNNQAQMSLSNSQGFNRKNSSKSQMQNDNQSKNLVNSSYSANNIMTDSGSSQESNQIKLSKEKTDTQSSKCQDKSSQQINISKQKYSSNSERIPVSNNLSNKDLNTSSFQNLKIDKQESACSQRNSNTTTTQTSSFYKNKGFSPNKKNGYSPSKKLSNVEILVGSSNATLKNSPIRQILSMHNHYQHNQFLGNKKALFYSMRKYYKSINQDVFQYLPLTFHVHSTDQTDEQFTEFKKVYQEELDKNKRKRLWILKPGQNSNRGKGITIHSDIEQLIELINSTVGDKKQIETQIKQKQNLHISQNSSQKLALNNTKRTFIIQQYIQKPFLYNKRKFDIRCYILLTSLNGSIKGYWYKEGYIRTSCFQFSLDSYSNSFVHLTNDAIQKNCEQYGKYQLGNKLSYQTFKRYLAFKYQKNKKYDFQTQIYDKIRAVAIDSIKASYHMLDNRKQKSKGNSNQTNHTVMEVFGLDFMIDDNFQPWLIQVNTNPCLETTCPVLQKIIPKMLDDALKLSIDVMYPPPADWPSSKKHLLGSIGNNGFQLVFDEQTYQAQMRNKEGINCQQLLGKSGYQLKLNLNNIYGMQGIGQIQEDDEIYEEQQEQ